MRLLKKARAAATRQRGSVQEDDAEQAGRRSSSLYAQRHLAESRSTISSENLNTVSPERTFTESSALTSDTEPRNHSLDQTQSPTRRSDHAPITPSPLNPFRTDSGSSGYTSSDGEGRGSSGEHAAPEAKVSTNGSSTIVAPAGQRSRSSTYSLLPPPRVVPEFQSAESPRSIEDLGQDYTRYPFYDRKHSSRPNILDSSRSLVNYSTPFGGSTTSLPVHNGTTILPDAENWGYPDDRVTAMNTYFGGEKGFILYPDEVEEDDGYHMPADDDDIKYRAKWRDYFSRRTVTSTIGALILGLGLLTLFVVFPVLTFGGYWEPSAPGTTVPPPPPEQPKGWDWVNDVHHPLLANVRQGLIDPDTPSDAMTRTSLSGLANLKLAFSDEFKTPNRSFWPGDDPFWTAANLWYGATQDLEWYDPDAVTTYGDALLLQLDAYENHNLQYRSGMVNSWNQLCFKGGVMEISLSLPGPAGISGLWPGVWTMGNLGRPGYKSTTDGVWPYTYNNCDVGITPNQSVSDGTSFLPGQKLSSCTCPNADHPNPGTGRGAPEIDVLEAGVDYATYLPIVTQSFQVAPFDIFYRPNPDYMAIPNPNFTMINPYSGGVYQQAVSGTTLTNPAWFDGKGYQKYGFEYTPGGSEEGGQITWFVADDPSFIMDSRAVGPNGNVGQRVVSEEPMSLTLNLGISNAWSYVNLAKLKFPTALRIDHVRIYQEEGMESITCDPPGYPTTEYIKNHPKAYQDVNLTSWAETEYSWPKNKLMGGC
ncbi:MAG: hypothetical protein M1818_006282 [Claussenomyces sp. TS43310]|nr:MAG: hypothetical protein M1818_006282 [Claussenomyces sp. TS43310]